MFLFQNSSFFFIQNAGNSPWTFAHIKMDKRPLLVPDYSLRFLNIQHIFMASLVLKKIAHKSLHTCTQNDDQTHKHHFVTLEKS